MFFPKPFFLYLQFLRLKNRRGFPPLLALGLLLTASCQRPQTTPGTGTDTTSATITAPVQQVLDRVAPDSIRAHIQYLAHDRLMGRKPGTAGFAEAAGYVERRFQSLGLQPAGENGSFRQPVLLHLGQTVARESSLQIRPRQGSGLPLTFGKDFLVHPNLLNAQSKVSAPVVYVGYGISAPELGHDDFAGVDVRGKIVAYFGGAPAGFGNNERAHFAREVNKQVLAAERGAVGTLLLSTAEAASAAWLNAVNRAASGTHAWVDAQGVVSNTFPQLQASATLSLSGVEALFAGAPRSMREVFEAARDGKTQAMELPVTVEIQGRTRTTPIQSHNVAAILPGSDPDLREEYVVYAAHIDHMGVGTPVRGDSIFNGAHDNASGVGMLIEIARTFATLPTAPRRSILFVGVTAEEMGLLGSDYFATHPTVPPGSMVTNLSIDMPFHFYPLLDVVPHGIQHSSLRQPVEQATRHLNIKISPDPTPEQVVFVRSDHYSFIKQGIPALFIKGGYETGDPTLDGGKLQMEWRANIYHTPLDNPDQDFDYGAGADHVRLNFLIGYLVANTTERPSWNTGDFFGERFGARNRRE